MRHDEQVRLIKQLCAQLDSGTTVDAGGVVRMSTTAYTDPVIAEREWQEFFVGMPHCIGLSGDLPELGSFITNNDLGIPILATRDQDGSFKAFVNSCRHRGVIVETQERGTTRRFTCPFHAWSYDTSGALVGLPKPEHFGDVDTSCLGLLPLQAEERHGLLFVHPDPKGTIDLDFLLGEWFNDEFSTWRFDRLIPLAHDSYDVASNWKLALDTFGETYHFPVLHKNTLNNGFHGNVQCYDEDGHLHRMILCKRAIDQIRLLPEDEWDIRFAGLPVYWLFPNIILMPFEAGVYLVRTYPDRANPGRHISRINFYVDPDIDQTNPGIKEYLDFQTQGFAGVIRDEDYVMGASQQTTANAAVMPHILFGRNEPALHHYHRTFRKMLGQEPLEYLSINE